MIPISGMSSYLGLKILDRTEANQQQLFRAEPQHSRAIETFYERVGAIETVDQFIDDYEVYSFVMKAFDLEDQIFGKAMMSKILKSNIEEDDALVNKLTDVRFKALYEEMGFGENGEGNLNTNLSSWQDRIVARYVDMAYVNAAAEQNDAVGAALEFRRKAAEVEGPFDILKDAEMATFMRTALGLPTEMVQIDIDRQAEIFEEKYDLTKLQDPEEVEALISRFLLISDAQDTSSIDSNAVVQLMTGAVSAGSGGSFVPVTIDITAVSALRGGY